MGVTHFLILSKTETAPYLRVARTPQGPTLTFKIQEYSLAVDVAHSQVRPRCPQDLFKNPPLVIIFFWGVHAQIYTSVQLRVYIVATDFHLIASYGNFANLRSIAQVFSWQWPERYHKWVPNFQLLEGLCFSNSYHWECYHEQPLKSSLDVSGICNFLFLPCESCDSAIMLWSGLCVNAKEPMVWCSEVDSSSLYV